MSRSPRQPRYLRSAYAAGNYAAREAERLAQVAANEARVRAAMVTLLEQPAEQRLRCAQGLMFTSATDYAPGLRDRLDRVCGEVDAMANELRARLERKGQ
jgi:hypothetical protein